MSIEAAAETDRAAGVAPAAPWRVKAITVLPNYCLAVTFNDGRQGVVDMSAVRASATCGMYAALKDPEVFAQAKVELGVVTWPNGADLDPAWMYEELEAPKTWSVPL
ncbi:MAG: DUF2442 domain-containing protein [Gammaproteobacteria bacterium]|jgi:hypothetical protein|nr:DUF2442 domain-containing protein [Gammaproteobacteria bacterium]